MKAQSSLKAWLAASALFGALIFPACGSSTGTKSAVTASCAGSVLLGSWVGQIQEQSDTMTFNSDCSATSSYCQANFTVPDVTATTGSLVVMVNATNGAVGCLPAGQSSCTYAVFNNVLSFNCGSSTLSYQHQ